MKKTILALALAAGLTSFAGNAKGFYSLNNLEIGSFYNVTFEYQPIALGDIVTFYGTNVNITSALITTENVVAYGYSSTSPVWSSLENVKSNSFSITCLEGTMGSITFGHCAAPITGYAVTDSSTAVKAEGVANKSTDVIPEPSTYALFGLGAIGMLMVLRRKKTA